MKAEPVELVIKAPPKGIKAEKKDKEWVRGGYTTRNSLKTLPPTPSPPLPALQGRHRCGAPWLLNSRPELMSQCLNVPVAQGP